MNVHAVIFDELHAQPNRELFDVMTKGSGDARTQPLYFLITTAGTDRNSICFEQHQKGGFGLALAIMCDNAGHKVTVWSKFQDEIDAIKRTGELKAKLPGVQVNKTIELTTDISCVVFP